MSFYFAGINISVLNHALELSNLSKQDRKIGSLQKESPIMSKDSGLSRVQTWGLTSIRPFYFRPQI